jgi:hypothetical protein
LSFSVRFCIKKAFSDFPMAMFFVSNKDLHIYNIRAIPQISY